MDSNKQTRKMASKKQTGKLALILSMAGLDGAVSLAALRGMFIPENAIALSFMFMAGPAAILSATLLEGTIKERMTAALIACIIATAIILLAAGLGAKMLSFLNLSVLKLIGGIAVITIGLLIIGIKIPETTPFILMISAIILSMIFR